MFVEDTPPPPPGDTEELERTTVQVSRFDFDLASIGQKHMLSHPLIGEPVYGLIYQMEIIEHFAEYGRKEYILHVEYER